MLKNIITTGGILDAKNIVPTMDKTTTTHSVGHDETVFRRDSCSPPPAEPTNRRGRRRKPSSPPIAGEAVKEETKPVHSDFIEMPEMLRRIPVCRKTLWSWCEKDFPHICQGGRVLFYWPSVVAYMLRKQKGGVL